MPRFFFDIHDGARHSLDEEGTVFADLEAASKEAVAVLPAIAANERTGADREIVATVRDEDGAALFRVRLMVKSEWLSPPEGGERG